MFGRPVRSGPINTVILKGMRESRQLKMRPLIRYLTKGAAKGDPRHMLLLYHLTSTTTTITTVVVFHANFRGRNLQELLILSPG